MPLSIGSIENHREREKGIIVYPVYSRRSGGLSIGINLFPDKKNCPFDCTYCEVFPFSANAEFSLEQMEHDLRLAIATAQQQHVLVKDICFSGNGEPSLSPDFPEALKLAGRIRSELIPDAEVVLITNGAGLLQPDIFSLLRDAATASLSLHIWLKLDAGTPRWYEKINRAEIPFETLLTKIKEFILCAPVTIQTMLCAVDGKRPSAEEARVWETAVLMLAAIAEDADNPQAGCGIRKVQIYGKARPAPHDPQAQALPIEYLEDRAASLRLVFDAANLVQRVPSPIVEVYP